MIAIVCSQCREGVLGLDEENCKFHCMSYQSRDFFKLTSIGWVPIEYQAVIECPECKSQAIIVDIHRIWREEKDKRRKK